MKGLDKILWQTYGVFVCVYTTCLIFCSVFFGFLYIPFDIYCQLYPLLLAMFWKRKRKNVQQIDDKTQLEGLWHCTPVTTLPIPYLCCWYSLDWLAFEIIERQHVPNCMINKTLSSDFVSLENNRESINLFMWQINVITPLKMVHWWCNTYEEVGLTW